MDTIILKRYAGGSNLNDLISSDTLFFPDSAMVAVGDTVYYKPNGVDFPYFWELKSNMDFVALLPATDDSFSIIGASAAPHSLYQEEEPCGGMDREEVITLQNIHINGNPAYPKSISYFGMAKYLFLKK